MNSLVSDRCESDRGVGSVVCADHKLKGLASDVSNKAQQAGLLAVISIIGYVVAHIPCCSVDLLMWIDIGLSSITDWGKQGDGQGSSGKASDERVQVLHGSQEYW